MHVAFLFLAFVTYSLSGKELSHQCKQLSCLLEYRASPIFSLLAEMRLDNFTWGGGGWRALRKSDQVYFLNQLFYISNLFNST